MLAAAIAGSNNIKVSNTDDFSKGQKIIIDGGDNSETATIKTVGTSGATTLGIEVTKGSTSLIVYSIFSFDEGQYITIDDGENLETVVIESLARGRRRFGQSNNNPIDTIKIKTPLTISHNTGVQISGSGITLTAPLIKDHTNGSPVTSNAPTPGQPNQYAIKP